MLVLRQLVTLPWWRYAQHPWTTLPFSIASLMLSHLVQNCRTPIFVCGHRPKTKELLELLLFLLFSIWFISSLKGILEKKILPSRDPNMGPPEPQSITLPTELRKNYQLISKIKPERLDQYWSTLVSFKILALHQFVECQLDKKSFDDNKTNYIEP